MIVCPVCEHAQEQGAECEVCGKRLAARAPAGPPLAAPVEGLEPTRHAAGGAIAGERVAGLEPTGHAAAGPAFDDPTPDLDRARAAPVDVHVAPVPEMEPTSEGIPGDAPTAVPAFVSCRYCRTPAMPGERVCGRCGMRLPSFAPPAADAASEARLCSCGAPVTRGLCPACGARH